MFAFSWSEGNEGDKAAQEARFIAPTEPPPEWTELHDLHSLSKVMIVYVAKEEYFYPCSSQHEL